jgi:DNA-binding transcriptional regulator LsrR (DeoR family)
MRMIVDSAHIDHYFRSSMPRLNIYIPDDLHALASAWRGSKNLSAICAQALREQLEAADTFRSADKFLAAIRSSAPLEDAVRVRFGLHDVVVCDLPPEELDLRAALGKLAAAYLDRNLCEGALLGMAGGRQTWCVVRDMAPRNVRLTVTAVGIDQHDPKVLHVHPNTLTTLLWLLYSPRAEAHLVGAQAFDTLWKLDHAPVADHAKYFILGSCSAFNPEAPFSKLLGEEAVHFLKKNDVLGDFGYVFFGSNGEPRPSPEWKVNNSTFSRIALGRIRMRRDARVILVGGGPDKLSCIRATLAANLCNVLITDATTARALLIGESTGRKVGRQKRRRG